MTREELITKFPKASEAFLRSNADQTVSHSAIGSTGPRQSTTPASEKPESRALIPMDTLEGLDLGECVVPVATNQGIYPVVHEIRLTLPYPISANNYWRSIIAKGRVMVLVSKEAKQYKNAIALIAGSVVKTPIVGPVSATYRVYRPQKSGDLSNRIKVLEDALEGVCYENDSQIVEMHAFRYYDKSNPRVELILTPHV